MKITPAKILLLSWILSLFTAIAIAVLLSRLTDTSWKFLHALVNERGFGSYMALWGEVRGQCSYIDVFNNAVHSFNLFNFRHGLVHTGA